MSLSYRQPEEAPGYIQGARHAMENVGSWARAPRFELADCGRRHFEGAGKVCLGPLLQLSRKA